MGIDQIKKPQPSWEVPDVYEYEKGGFLADPRDGFLADPRITLVQQLVEVDSELMELEMQYQKMLDRRKQLKEKERKLRAELRERLGLDGQEDS